MSLNQSFISDFSVWIDIFLRQSFQWMQNWPVLYSAYTQNHQQSNRLYSLYTIIDSNMLVKPVWNLTGMKLPPCKLKW